MSLYHIISNKCNKVNCINRLNKKMLSQICLKLFRKKMKNIENFRNLWILLIMLINLLEKINETRFNCRFSMSFIRKICKRIKTRAWKVIRELQVIVKWWLNNNNRWVNSNNLAGLKRVKCNNLKCSQVLKNLMNNNKVLDKYKNNCCNKHRVKWNNLKCSLLGKNFPNNNNNKVLDKCKNYL